VVFIGVLAAYFAAGLGTFDILVLHKQIVANPQLITSHVQIWVFPLIFVGFGVLAGIAVSHLGANRSRRGADRREHVAGRRGHETRRVRLSAGAMLLFPAGFEYWRWVIAWLAVIAIVYGAAVALVQRISSSSLAIPASATWAL